MKQVLPLPLIILALVGSAAANPTGSNDSPSLTTSTAPGPDDPESAVRTTAAAYLAGFLRKQADHHLCRIHLGDSAIWIELSGLHLSHVVANPVSPTDEAEGITDSRLVRIDYTTYRARSPRAAQWSQWSDRPNPLLPSAIRVEKGPNGHWQARPKDFQLMTRFTSQGDPGSIPHLAQPATAVQASK
jgi:hypothetical protein